MEIKPIEFWFPISDDRPYDESFVKLAQREEKNFSNLMSGSVYPVLRWAKQYRQNFSENASETTRQANSF